MLKKINPPATTAVLAEVASAIVSTLSEYSAKALPSELPSLQLPARLIGCGDQVELFKVVFALNSFFGPVMLRQTHCGCDC